jgi:hypothetical protein
MYLKNVFIITYNFPPMTGIGGLRQFGLAKYLPIYGWTPIILTPILPGDPDKNLRVIQTPDYDVIKNWKRRLGLNPKKTINETFHINIKKGRSSIIDYLTYIPGEIISYPDDKKGWYDYAVSSGERILQTEKIDAILSSSTPVTCHLIAKTLADKYHIPWIADFRDLWTQNHYVSHSPIRNYFEKKLEIKTIKHASAITTVSQPLADTLALLHKNKKIFSIENGFDPELISTEKNLDKFFKIVYTGVLYKGKRDPAQLFEVIRDLCESGHINRADVKIDFFGYPSFGRYECWLEEDITKNHLEDVVTLHSKVPRVAAITEQRKSQMLLLLTWDNSKEDGVYTGKLFEYLAARRPILSLGYTGGGVIKDLLMQTQAGVHVGNIEELKDAVLTAYHEFKESGAVQYRGIDAEVMKYSHKEMARNFAQVLDTVIK